MLEAEMVVCQQGPVSIGSNQGEDPCVVSPQMIAELDLLTFAAKMVSVFRAASQTQATGGGARRATGTVPSGEYLGDDK